MTKEELRKRIKEQRDLLPQSEQKRQATAIYDQLIKLRLYQNCNRIFTYVSFGTEVDTIEILQQAFADHKKVYIPKVDGLSMDFYEITSLKDLVKSNYGAMEPLPVEENRYLALQEEPKPPVRGQKTDSTKLAGEPVIDKLMLVPGIAFDREGNRIGFGGGYYDRYLTSFASEGFFTAALAYDFQFVDEITVMEYDVAMDAIITSGGVHLCGDHKNNRINIL